MSSVLQSSSFSEQPLGTSGGETTIAISEAKDSNEEGEVEKRSILNISEKTKSERKVSEIVEDNDLERTISMPAVFVER